MYAVCQYACMGKLNVSELGLSEFTAMRLGRYLSREEDELRRLVSM